MFGVCWRRWGGVVLVLDGEGEKILRGVGGGGVEGGREEGGALER